MGAVLKPRGLETATGNLRRGQRWSDRLHCVKRGMHEGGVQSLSSPCLGHTAGCHMHRHSHSLNFLLPTLKNVIDGTHRLSGADGGVAPPHTPRVVLTSGLAVGTTLNNTQRLHLGSDPSVLSGLNGFANSRVMEAVGCLCRTGQERELGHVGIEERSLSVLGYIRIRLPVFVPQRLD